MTKIQNNMEKMGKIATKYKGNLRKNPTKAEFIVKDLLKYLGVSFTFQKLIYCPERYFIADFVINLKRKRILEIDGGYHDVIKHKDAEREKLILATKVYRKAIFHRITNEEVYRGDFVKIFAMFRPRHLKIIKTEGYKDFLRNLNDKYNLCMPVDYST